MNNAKPRDPVESTNAPESGETPASSLPAMPLFRVGEGWDTHALATGRPLVLGGVTIPHSHGLLGHSDADALLHAITDALLGAAALGDIGRHFPDTDPQFLGADSTVLLAEAMRRVRAQGWELNNVDATIVAQAPKMAPHIPAMCQRIASVLGVTVPGLGTVITVLMVCMLISMARPLGGGCVNVMVVPDHEYWFLRW